jgi:hypothetical protein
MKQTKLVLFLMIALCGSLTLHAQKTKKKSKATTTQTAAKIKYQCPMNCEGDKVYSKAGKCPVCNMNLKEQKAVTTAYQCSMKCEGDKTYAKAGKCPVCNMNLKAVPSTEKKKDDHAGHSH